MKNFHTSLRTLRQNSQNVSEISKDPSKFKEKLNSSSKKLKSFGKYIFGLVQLRGKNRSKVQSLVKAHLCFCNPMFGQLNDGKVSSANGLFNLVEADSQGNPVMVGGGLLVLLRPHPPTNPSR